MIDTDLRVHQVQFSTNSIPELHNKNMVVGGQELLRKLQVL